MAVLLGLDIFAFLIRKYDFLDEESKLFEPVILPYFLSIDTQEKLFGGYFTTYDNTYNKSKKNNLSERADQTNSSGYRWIRVKQEKKIHEREILRVLLGLDDEKLDKLLELYEQEFGRGAARYARRTYRKWESGKVQPIRQTYERFLLHLPDVMNFEMKTELLRRLMEEYCKKDSYKLTVYTDDWEETLEPLVAKLIEKPFIQSLPKQIEDKLIWLAHDDMQAAEKILKQSQVEEGKIAVSMLREEFANIEHLLVNTKGKRRGTHELKFPYGMINLKIKRR